MTQLDHLEELLAKAHPLPWENHPVKGYSHDEVFARDPKGGILCICADGDADYRDAPLIVEAINALPSLIADIRAKEERIRVLEAERTSLVNLATVEQVATRLFRTVLSDGDRLADWLSMMVEDEMIECRALALAAIDEIARRALAKETDNG